MTVREMNKPLTQKNNRASLRWAVTTPALSTVSENNPSESRVSWRSTHASSTLRLPVPRRTEEFVLGTPSAMSVMQIMASNLPSSLLSGCSWGCSAAHGPHGWEFGLVPTQLHHAGEPAMLFPFGWDGCRRRNYLQQNGL